MIPNKNPQNLHTPKYIHFSENPKNSKIQNLEPKKWPEPIYVWKYQSTTPPPFVKYKCSLYFHSTYTWLNLIYYSIIFLFTDTCNNDVLSRPQTVIYWVFKQAGLKTVSYRNLPQAGLNRVALQIFNCDIDAWLNKLQEHHPYTKGLGPLNKLAQSSSMREWGEGLVNI